MSSIYQHSNDIDVFPTTKRNAEHSDARLLTESNIVSIANRLLDKKSFVISMSSDNNITITFNIEGYFVKVVNFGRIIDSIGEQEQGKSIFANIRRSKIGKFTELCGSDIADTGEAEVYTGVMFTCPGTYSSSPDWSYLELVRYSDENGWEIPLSSFEKISSNSLPHELDCGRIL